MLSIEAFDSKTQAEFKKIKYPEDIIRMFEVLDIRDFDMMADWNYKILPKYVADCTLNCYMRYIFILFIFNKILSKYGYDGKMLIGLPSIPVVYNSPHTNTIDISYLVVYFTFIYKDVDDSSSVNKFRLPFLNFKNNKSIWIKYFIQVNEYKANNGNIAFPFPYIIKLKIDSDWISISKIIGTQYLNEEIKGRSIKDLKGVEQQTITFNIYSIDDYRVLASLIPYKNFAKPLYQNIINIRPIYTIQNFNIVE